MINFLLKALPFIGDKLLPRVLQNKDQVEDNSHKESVARLDQFAAEFSDKTNRTWWDSFVDGLNRLPRPLMAFGVMAIFIWASIDPVAFTAAAQAWALIPENMWLILSAIVVFFFGDRTLKGFQKPNMPTVDQVKQVLKTQEEINKLSLPEPTPEPVTEERYQREMADESKPLSNEVILEWNRRRSNAAG